MQPVHLRICRPQSATMQKARKQCLIPADNRQKVTAHERDSEAVFCEAGSVSKTNSHPFSCERSTVSSAEYGDNVRAKLEHAQTIDPAAVERARESMQLWREYRPDVDLYVSPTLGIEIPPEDCSEIDVRIAVSAFLRPFNVLGWAGLAIGDLQFVAPRDEVVLAAGLAWERA